MKLNKIIGLKDIGTIVKIYTGKTWINITVIEGMLYHYLGEFILTRRHATAGVLHKIKIKKKKKNKKWVG